MSRQILDAFDPAKVGIASSPYFGTIGNDDSR